MATVIIFCLGAERSSFAVATFDEAKRASATIGQWISRATIHNHLLSATPIGPRRPGSVFFTHYPDWQTASDYGVSMTSVPCTDDLKSAYETLGISSASLGRTLDLTRFNAAWGFFNTLDFSFSLINSTELRGWGGGLKIVLSQWDDVFLSYQFGYSRASKDQYFVAETVSNEVMVSYFRRIIDGFVGVRHLSGTVEFDASNPQLQLPKVNYFSYLSQLEYFTGVVLASTLNTRLTGEFNYNGRETWVAGKVSFRFDSLFPTNNDWFADPRRMKY